MPKLKSLAQIGYDSTPEEGGKSNFGRWEEAPEVVRRVHRQTAKAIERAVKRRHKSINAMVKLCHSRSKKAGWWTDNANLAEKICLIHSELSEAMEGLRKDLMDDKLPHRKMEEVEMADAVIRIFDYCGRRGFDLEGAIMEKLAFNESRPDHKIENRAKQGGKKF